MTETITIPPDATNIVVQNRELTFTLNGKKFQKILPQGDWEIENIQVIIKTKQPLQ